MAASDIPRELYERMQAISLALPETVEKETWGHPTFRVRDKIFSGIGVDDESGRVTTSLKAAPGEQEVLLAEGPPFFRPPYVGNRGWIGIVLDADTDWDEIAELVEDSYRAVAPTKLSALLDD